MKTHLFLPVLSLILFFAACSSDKPAKAIANKKDRTIEYLLPADSMYSATAIERTMKRAGVRHKNESNRHFMEGLDLLVNKNDPSASIHCFREAIFYYPDEKNFQHLFLAYLRSGNGAMADSVNKTLWGRIDYSESSFNGALIAALAKDTSSCFGWLNDAAMQGFMFKDRLTEEPLFAFLKDNPSWDAFLFSHFGDDEKLRRKMFALFLKTFPDLELPFEINADSAANFNGDNDINYDFATFIPGMEEGSFSRDVSNLYMYVGKFRTQDHIAVIYKTYNMISDTLNPVHTNIMLFDTAGVMASETELGCFCSPLESKAFIINKDQSIRMSTYKTKWENDPLEKGYSGNKIVSRDEIGKTTVVPENGQLVTKPDDRVASSDH